MRAAGFVKYCCSVLVPLPVVPAAVESPAVVFALFGPTGSWFPKK